MAPSSGPGWLKSVLLEAKARGWCTKPLCTTCGGRVFRTAVQKGAIAAATAVRQGVPDSPLSPDEFARLREESALIEELRTLERAVVRENVEAIRAILLGVKVGAHKESLKGCPVGDVLDSMVSHSQALRTERIREDELERTAPLRKAARLAANAAKHQERLAEKATRDARRAAILRELSEKSEVDRLQSLVREHSDLPLSAVPRSLVPTEGMATLSMSDQAALRSRAGGLKAWKALLGST